MLQKALNNKAGFLSDEIVIRSQAAVEEICDGKEREKIFGS